MQLLIDIRCESFAFLCRVENAGQSSSGPKEHKPQDSESEAIESNELIKHGRDNGKTGFEIRNKVFTYSDYFTFCQEIYENLIIL